MGHIISAKATCKLQSAATKNTTIIGNIEVANFEKPTIKWDGTAMLEAAFILGLIDSSAFDAKSGVASIDGKLTLTYDIQKGATVPNSLRYAGTILLELPDQANAVKVVVNDQCITGESEPLVVLDNAELQHAASDE